MYKTLKLRIYTKHTPKLVKLASAVNFVWNYVNDLSFQVWRRKRVFLSAYDIHEYTKGAGEELGLHSQTLQAVGETHAKARKQANWSEIERQLEYKCEHAGCLLVKVNENFSTQTCANCLQITNSSPKGEAGLGIREWICGCCGRLTDRDVNAAKNILRFGRETLAEGSPVI